MATLITGAAGFVALNVVEHLLRTGRDVVGLDRIMLPERARLKFAALPGRFTLIGGSVLSAADLVAGAVGALMAAARLGVKRFVYPSSGAIYGAGARDVPLIDE